MRRTLLVTGLALMMVALASAVSSDPKCVVVTIEGTAVQAGGAFTPWEGPLKMRLRGRVVEGWGTILATDSNAPFSPPYHLVGFSKVLYDFGPTGSFSTWAVSEFVPDATFYNWQFSGYELLGSPLSDPFGWGTAAFAQATGWLKTSGSMRFADPPPPGVPNTLDATLSGRICGIDWAQLLASLE